MGNLALLKEDASTNYLFRFKDPTMSLPWYRECFAGKLGPYADLGMAGNQIAREVAYLQKVLATIAPGRRVVDMGHSVSPHALGLAQAGFKIMGWDVSERAICPSSLYESGRTRCEVAGPLATEPGPREVDAAICIDGLGAGSQANPRALLRRLRRHLVPTGALILAQTNPVWLLRHWEDSVTMLSEEKTFRLNQEYDPVTGCIETRIIVSEPGEPDFIVQQDIRLYSVVELSELVREAGFIVDRIDSDFNPGNTVDMDSPTFQVVARALSAPPHALAVAHWRSPSQPDLNLRYAPDETEWLDPTPDQLWQEVICSDGCQGANAAEHYPVDDPYGAERGAEIVASHFGCPVATDQLTFGCGVTALLRDLAGLADGGLVLMPKLTHPDLTAWSVICGTPVYQVSGPVTAARLIERIETCCPTLVHMDRPTLMGEVLSLEDLEAIGHAAAKVGALILIDESPATYLGPLSSAVPLIHRLNNLVVLRSVTKAYSRGGLRVGYAVASEDISNQVRELVPPLQVGELAYHAVLRLLAAGDIFQRLRARVREIKPRMVSLLQSSGLEVIEGHPELSWVLVSDVDQNTSRRLNHCGIMGLRLSPSPLLPGKYPEFLHLAIPLSGERIAEVERRMQGFRTISANESP